MSTLAPEQTDIIEAVERILPTVQEHASWQEEHRRLHEETVEALRDAGVFRLRTPQWLGGLEADTSTLEAVASRLAEADGSTGWVASVYWIPGWMVGQFPESVQQEIYADPDTAVCGTLSPGGMAKPTEGGIRLDGKWSFISGALHADWQEIIAVQFGENGEPQPVVALVPMSDLHIVDDWHTVGMRGSGSVTTVADDVFVPSERVVPLGVVIQGAGSSSQHGRSRIHRVPLLPVASATSVGTMLGLTSAAARQFHQDLPGRKLTYTSYNERSEAPVTHLTLSRAQMLAREASFHARELTDSVDLKAVDGAEWSLQERVTARARLGACVDRASQAINLLANASGASSIYLNKPIQRVHRDATVVTRHALMNPETNSELHGRVLCGLEPNSDYI